jgi:Vps5 C terminal like/PX domain
VYEAIVKERPGAIVPLIPHKTALTPKIRFSDELVGERQQQLQRFLERVLQHPELHDCPSLHTFLTADYNVWENTKKQGTTVGSGDSHAHLPRDLQLGDESEESGLDGTAGNPDSSTPTQKSSGNRIATWLGKKVSQTRVAMGSLQLESTPDDDIFNDLHSYANNIDTNIKILAKDATLLVAATKTQADKMEQMAAAFSEMGEYKLDNEIIIRTSSSSMFTKLGQNWNNLSKLTNFAHMSGLAKLDEPIQDLARDVHALLKAISQRKDALLLYTRKANQGKTKMGQLDKLRENVGGNPDKIANLEGEVRTLKEEGAELWKEVDIISKRLQRDAERFKIYFHQTMRTTMEIFHKVQVEYSQKYIQGWGDVLPFLAPLNTPTAMAGPPASAPPDVPNDEPVTVVL